MNSDMQLKAKIAQEFDIALGELSFDDKWTYYYTDEIPEHSKDRIILFRASQSSPRIGCIRVRHKEDIKRIVWDIVGKDGIYIGLVPANCPTEAMLVESKFMILN
ncbi:uncharacterized protein EKO05_0001949 [Ascochyta rabiei]|uniref:uncharacterized protein n=1 Tax=Didymella rabiei TaxID=5454 RepID=UPI0022012CE1|nr:uncharacterized protein EKO05_0001949 [Ascochyta rabiei]UPX11342.1 hypothetical protein EKO05_0001949 [Ascochyta rabiei]